MLLLSVRGFLDYAGPTVHSRLAWLPCCLPPTRNEVGVLIYGLFAAQWPRPPMPLVYASKDTSRCLLQDSRSGWIRYFLSCRALASPTTCRFYPGALRVADHSLRMYPSNFSGLRTPSWKVAHGIGGAARAHNRRHGDARAEARQAALRPPHACQR